MRRGLLKDLANTPTQIACGWRMYGDLSRLSANSGAEIVIDLLHGTETCDGAPVKPSLELGDMAVSWFRERLERDRVPPGMVESATLVLTPTRDNRGLVVHCATAVRTGTQTFESQDTARWHPGDVDAS